MAGVSIRSIYVADFLQDTQNSAKDCPHREWTRTVGGSLEDDLTDEPRREALKRRGRKDCSVNCGLEIDTGSLMSLIESSGKASGKASSRNDLLPGNREKKPRSAGGPIAPKQVIHLWCSLALGRLIREAAGKDPPLFHLVLAPSSKAINLALWYVSFAAASGLLRSGNEVHRERLQRCMPD
jgi:hypothetical protein